MKARADSSSCGFLDLRRSWREISFLGAHGLKILDRQENAFEDREYFVLHPAHTFLRSTGSIWK